MSDAISVGDKIVGEGREFVKIIIDFKSMEIDFLALLQ